MTKTKNTRLVMAHQGTKNSWSRGYKAIRGTSKASTWYWLVAVVAAISGYAVKAFELYQDRPSLHVVVSADTPQFRMNDKEEWSADNYKTQISERIDFLVASLVSDRLQKKGLLTAGGVHIIQKTAGSPNDLMDSVQMRLPFHVRVSNNGGAPTTIVSARVSLYDNLWEKPVTSPIKDVREHIGPGEVRDLKNKEISIRGALSMPRSAYLEAMFEIADSWISFHYPETKDKKDILDIKKMMMLEFGPIINKATGKDLGFQIEVELTDQFGNTAKGSTGTLHLDPHITIRQN